jgi:hypothetical protein
MFMLASMSGFDWTIFGCVALVAISVGAFRTATRRFDWGPRDT